MWLWTGMSARRPSYTTAIEKEPLSAYDGPMSNAYLQLLDAAIQHLEEMKANGTRFISVSSEAVAALRRSSARDAKESASSAAVMLEPPPKPKAPIGFNSSAPLAAPKSVPEPGFSVAFNGEAAPSSSLPTLSPEARMAAFADLRARVLACVKCQHLAASRKNVVFGVGNISAELMFVGEAPGADEDIQGEPFVGRAGQLLTKIIETMGLTRESVYIANILKCRPDTPGQPTGNRKPTPEEMQTCIPFLHEQIDLIRPKVLVALGGTAIEGLLGKTSGITRLRGNWQSYRGIPLMPTYHPAYLLRNAAPMEKRRLWEDMLQVMEKIGMTISERQRNFFLTK